MTLQQYMYLKQLEWSKWAAVDEIQRTQASASATEVVSAPVTPPREPMELSSTIPPVTPHRYAAKSAAATKGLTTPGQPRKTPVAKRDRVAMDPDEDEDADADELGGFGVVGGTAPVRKSPRTGAARVPASERTVRTTRSTTNARKVAGTTTATTGAGTKTGGTGPPPHKIPRLAANSSSKGTTTSVTRRRPLAGSPTATAPSRLPTLVNRRALAPTTTLPNLRSQAPPAPDAWMNKDPSAVVVPGSKSERPLLRNVRRRRSSFSAADVVA